jgi:hypothetical protein
MYRHCHNDRFVATIRGALTALALLALVSGMAAPARGERFTEFDTLRVVGPESRLP